MHHNYFAVRCFLNIDLDPVGAVLHSFHNGRHRVFRAAGRSPPVPDDLDRVGATDLVESTSSDEKDGKRSAPKRHRHHNNTRQTGARCNIDARRTCRQSTFKLLVQNVRKRAVCDGIQNAVCKHPQPDKQANYNKKHPNILGK